MTDQSLWVEFLSSFAEGYFQVDIKRTYTRVVSATCAIFTLVGHCKLSEFFLHIASSDCHQLASKEYDGKYQPYRADGSLTDMTQYTTFGFA